MKTRRFALGALLALACAGSALAGARAQSQTYPDKPIRLIVPFTPGGVTDNIGRVLAERMGRELGQSIIIDNRAGANGRIGTDAVAKAAPDGYTLLLGGIGALTIHPHMLKVPYDPVNDFVPISLVATNDVVIVVNPKLPVKTPAELVAYAKANGNKMQYGSSGIGAPTHLAAELFKTRVGSAMVHVPYKGDSAAVMDVVAGNVDLSFSTVSATLSLIQAGKLRAIAMTGLQRSQSLPDVPTLDETVLKGFNADTWVGLFAPARTPDPIIKRLYEATKAALADPEVRRKLIAGGNNIVGNDTAQFRAFLDAESKKWGEVIRAGNIKLDE
ncbi:MAG: tripartite tricarboxylate transporter substrate binding protein [Reyranella sp.]|uniref:Bug family tripartite tricarboxylate transporter substrate binding protein n=1 Tax=Reyranella sp. TaxID=1929291 RepID=UPI001217C9CC|nr:tripartite tricarboxylate transporter substrate binding protein [Reyranella sp.]TAJ84371.1 MAG: tripartite tricarboxylate transporter substrate binding protein [Reyranella sp.]